MIALLFSFFILQTHAEAAIAPHVKKIVIEDLLIDKKIRSMYGPYKNIKNIDFNISNTETKNIWITKYTIKTKENNKYIANDFLCHGVLRSFNDKNQEFFHLGVSAGQQSIEFPKQYALRIPTDSYTFSADAMALNYFQEKIFKKINFEIEIEYFTDAEATHQNLIPLVSIPNPMVIESKKSESAHNFDSNHHDHSKHVTKNEPDPEEAMFLAHWMVPPGRHEYVSANQKRIHLNKPTEAIVIQAHVHPFAESIELFDASTKKTIWHTKIKSSSRSNSLLDVPNYTLTQDKKIILPKDAEYKVRVVYNNILNEKIDAMASIKLFVPETNVNSKLTRTNLHVSK